MNDKKMDDKWVFTVREEHHEIHALLREIRIYQPLQAKNEILRRATALGVSEQWDPKQYINRRIETTEEDNAGVSMNFTVDRESWLTLLQLIREAFTPTLKRVTNVYALRLVLSLYLDFLKKSQGTDQEAEMESPCAKDSPAEEEIELKELLNELLNATQVLKDEVKAIRELLMER